MGLIYFILNNFSEFFKLLIMNYHFYSQKTNATKLLNYVTDYLWCESLVKEETKEPLRTNLPKDLCFVFTELQKWPERPKRQVEVSHPLHSGRQSG